MNIQLGKQMGLNNNHGIGHKGNDLDTDGVTRKKNGQPVYALDLDNKNGKKQGLPFLSPWNCKKDHLYPETNYLRNIKDMSLHDQQNTIRTYILCVFAGKNKTKK